MEHDTLTHEDDLPEPDEPEAEEKADADLSRVLTEDEIMSVVDITEKTVQIPEWNGSVVVRALTKGQHRAMRKRSTKKGQIDQDLLEDNIVAFGLVQPKLTPEGISRLKEKKAGAVEKVYDAILDISGLKEEAAAEAEATFQD